jgi:uncharacterized protein
MYVNIINSYRDIVAICDKDLLGKKFFEEKRQLDIKESFYKGELKSKEEVKKIINNAKKEDATFNIVGEESIKLALEEGIITNEGIGKTDGIPYALVLL